MSLRRFVRWRGFRGFAVQLVLTAVVPVGLVLIAFTLVAASLHREAMRTLVGHRDLRTVRLLASLWEAQWNHRQNLLLEMARRDRVPPPEMLEMLLHGPFDRGVWRVDQQGRWIPVTVPSGSNVRPPFSPNDPTVPGRVRWSLVRRGRPTVWMAASDGSGGWWAGGFSLEALGGYGSVALEPPTALALLAPEGQALVVYAGPWPLEKQETDLKMETAEGVRTLSLGGEEYVFSFVRLHPTGWYLVLGEPWTAAAGPWLQVTEWVPLALVPVLLLSLILLWMGVTRVVQPLQVLEARASQVAWGQRDALAEPVGGVEEIQRLQRTLHHMAQKLQQAHRNLRSYLAALTAGQEEERRRLARELHDETLQNLIALQQRLQLAAQDARDQPQVQARLEELQSLIRNAVLDLRRVIRDLRPLYLEELGLIPALEALVQEARSHTPDLTIELLVQGEVRRLQADQELALFRIAQEALRNAIRHARATQAQVVLAFEPHQVRLEIRDNGQGFRVPESPADLAPQGHYGLLGMQERAERLGATLHLHSELGQGTLVSVHLPLSPPPKRV